MANVAPFIIDQMLTAVVNTINAAGNNPNATLRIYTAPVPPTPIDGITGLLLATVLLPDPAASGPSNQQITLLTSGVTAGVQADGRAAFFRLQNRAGTTILDGTVGVTGSGADLELAFVDLTTSDILNLGNIPLTIRCPT